MVRDPACPLCLLATARDPTCRRLIKETPGSHVLHSGSKITQVPVSGGSLHCVSDRRCKHYRWRSLGLDIAVSDSTSLL
jgi:hypothetical protein